nr:cingulin-like isoform X2 [Ipomoea batatas]
MNSYQDLTSVGAEGDEANRVVGAETNASDMDDSENSYVFVNGSDGTSDDPGANELDTDVPAASAETKVVENSNVSGDLNKSFEEERHGSLQGIGVFLSTNEGEISEDCLAGKENLDGTQVASNDSVQNQIEAVESQKYESTVESKPQTSQGQIDLKSSSVTSQDQVDLRSSSVTDSGDANQVTQEIILDSVVDLVNLDSATEQNNIDLTVDQHNSDSDLTVDQHSSDSTVGVENADSVIEQNKLGSTNNIDLTIITVEGENNQHVVVDAAECDPDKTEVKKGNYVGQTLNPCDVLEEGEKCTMAPMDDFECKSQHAKPEVGEVNGQQQFEVMATEIVEDGESYTHVNIPVESNSCELDHEGENLEKESSKGFSSDANPELERVRVDQGHEMENVVNEKHTSLEAGVAISPVLCDKQVSVLVSHATDHVSQSEEGGGKIDVSESCHEFNRSSEEAKIMGAPAACMTSEGDTREKPIDTTGHVSQLDEGTGHIDVGESSHELSRSSDEAKIMGAPAVCMMTEGDTREKPIDTTDHSSQSEEGSGQIDVGAPAACMMSEGDARENPIDSIDHVSQSDEGSGQIDVDAPAVCMMSEGDTREKPIDTTDHVSQSEEGSGQIGVGESSHDLSRSSDEAKIISSPAACMMSEGDTREKPIDNTDHVSESEECRGQIDVGESSHELSRSSEEAKIMGTPAACVMNEGDTTEKPIDTTDHVSESEECRGQIDVGESSHELSRSSEEAKIMGTPAACVMNEGDTREKPIDTTAHVSQSEGSGQIGVGECSHELSRSSEEAKIISSPAACMMTEGGTREKTIDTTDHVSESEGSGQIDVGESSHELNRSSEEAKIMGAPAACVMSEGDTREKPIDTTDHVSQSEEVSGQIDVGESSHELSGSSEEAKIMDDPAACMMSEGDTREKLIDETIGNVSADCENRYRASLPTESISVQDAEVLEPRSCDEHVVSSVADGSCAIVMNSLENDTSLGTEFGIQNSASEEVSALAGGSSLHDSKSENLDAEAAVVESKFLGHDSISSCSPTDSSSKTTSSLLTDKSEQKVQGGTEISNEGAELAHGQSSSTVVQLSEVGNSSTSINRDMHGDDTLVSGLESLRSSFDNNGSPPNHTKNLEVQCNGSERSGEDNLVCQEFVVADKSLCNETLDILLDGSSANVAGQDVSTVTFEGLKKPFQFLIKMPRFDDEKLREQIRLAQLHVDEKTQSRDAIWQEIKKKRANCQHHGVEFEAAKSEERAARKLVRSKRAEIEHLQTAINRVKNAISVEEIDARICSMENMIEHETLPLKEEKNLIREIKQLKQLRDQLSSNIGSCDEVQQALDNRDQIEESLKILKKELDSLKTKVSKAEAVAVAVSLRYEEESKMHKELRAQYKAANEIRQAAYENFQNLKKILYEKNNHFRMYKDNASTASRHAARKDTEALHHLCANQVEKYMELWNRDDEFRKEYVRCNMRSTVRRLGTLDGRSLGPNEDPPVLPVYVAERTDKVISRTSKVDFVSPTLPLQQEKQVMLIKDEDIARNPMVKVTGQKTERERKSGAVKSNLESADDTVSSWDVSNDVKREDIQILTKEELELARKEEELKRLETAARLKEQRRLEEIAKAKEALERKKRNAEKAQVRAELRAQKEAEQKEKVCLALDLSSQTLTLPLNYWSCDIRSSGLPLELGTRDTLNHPSYGHTITTEHPLCCIQASIELQLWDTSKFTIFTE